jgi:hypothetical protein
MFECIVCGATTQGRAHLYGSAIGPVALCGFRCCRLFLLNPLEYVLTAPEEIGVND